MKLLSALALATSWIGVVHAGTGCVMIGHGEARIHVEGQDRSPPVRFADCDGVKVVTGTVSACFMSDRNERTCRTLKAGDTFDAVAFAAHPGAGSGAFRSTLASLLKGDPQTRIGQTRAERPTPGFPYKNVLAPDGGLVIRLQTEKAQKVKSLRLAAIGIVSSDLLLTPTNGQFVVPASALSRGTEYAWEAVGDDTKIRGRFRVALASEVEQIKLAVAPLVADDSLDEVSRRVLLAEFYFENGYAFDAAELMAPLIRQ